MPFTQEQLRSSVGSFPVGAQNESHSETITEFQISMNDRFQRTCAERYHVREFVGQLEFLSPDGVPTMGTAFQVCQDYDSASVSDRFANAANAALSAQIIVTCAHNLVKIDPMTDEMTYYHSHQYLPGRSGPPEKGKEEEQRFFNVKEDSWIIHPQFREYPSWEHGFDLAVAVLEEDTGLREEHSIMPIASHAGKEMGMQMILGYAANPADPTKECRLLSAMGLMAPMGKEAPKSEIHKKKSGGYLFRHIFHGTQGGMSGGPVVGDGCIGRTACLALLGVHVGQGGYATAVVRETRVWLEHTILAVREQLAGRGAPLYPAHSFEDGLMD